MSYSKFERGKFIREKMMYTILIDSAHGKITTEEWGRVYDLISEVETAGTTHCQELAQNKYYIKAVAEWVKHKKTRRQQFAKSKST